MIPLQVVEWWLAHWQISVTLSWFYVCIIAGLAIRKRIEGKNRHAGNSGLPDSNLNYLKEPVYNHGD